MIETPVQRGLHTDLFEFSGLFLYLKHLGISSGNFPLLPGVPHFRTLLPMESFFSYLVPIIPNLAPLVE